MNIFGNPIQKWQTIDLYGNPWGAHEGPRKAYGRDTSRCLSKHGIVDVLEIIYSHFSKRLVSLFRELIIMKSGTYQKHCNCATYSSIEQAAPLIHDTLETTMSTSIYFEVVRCARLCGGDCLARLLGSLVAACLRHGFSLLNVCLAFDDSSMFVFHVSVMFCCHNLQVGAQHL